MNFLFLFFLAAALLLVGLLLWAVRPPKITFDSADAVFEALSAPRHYYRLPQILQALQVSDTEFFAERGYPELGRRLRAERRTIALEFVKCIETDYRTLIEASRMLAAMAPEVMAAHEWERFRLSVAFAWNCRLVRWRLQAGLGPWSGFAQISDSASALSYRLERVTTRIAERATLSSELPSLLQQGSDNPR